jgi:hypothetical protein
VLANDVAGAAGLVTVTISTPPTRGSAIPLPNNSISFTPAQNFNGIASFQYRVCDSSIPTPLCSTASVLVAVTGQAPIASPDSATVNEGASISIPVCANDQAAPGSSLNGSSVSIIATSAASSSITTGPVDCNGGLSWGGWTYRGKALDVGIWMAGEIFKPAVLVSRDYELYTTMFAFNNHTVTGKPIQYAYASQNFSAGTESPGSFANGNTIFGIGCKLTKGYAYATYYVTFSTSGRSKAASALGAEDGKFPSTIGDLTVGFNYESNFPPSRYPPDSVAGVSISIGGTDIHRSVYRLDWPMRIFRQGDLLGSVQIFFDLTTMNKLWGVGGSQLNGTYWRYNGAHNIYYQQPINIATNMSVAFGSGYGLGKVTHSHTANHSPPTVISNMECSAVHHLWHDPSSPALRPSGDGDFARQLLGELHALCKLLWIGLLRLPGV